MSNSIYHKVTIIIPSYNGLSFLKKCLSTIKKQIYPNIEVVLVDNNSTDKTYEYISTHYPQILIVRNKANYGFAKPNNQAAKIGKGEFLFFLNNDTELFPDVIEKLVMAHQPKSILTAYQIPTRDKSLAGRCGGGMDIFGYPFVNHSDLKSTKIFYADGAALFIRRKDFFDIGMFDEKLFMFQEDIDLSWRGQMMGYTISPCWNVKLYHYYGGTSSIDLKESKQYFSSYFRRYLNERNIIRNILKNYSFPFAVLILSLLLVFHSLEIILFVVTGNIKVVKCYFAGYYWNIKNIKDTLKMRREIQKKRLVSDWVLLSRMYLNYSKLYTFLKIGMPRFQ